MGAHTPETYLISCCHQLFDGGRFPHGANCLPTKR
jgi:hypothetical protein